MYTTYKAFTQCHLSIYVCVYIVYWFVYCSILVAIILYFVFWPWRDAILSVYLSFYVYSLKLVLLDACHTVMWIKGVVQIVLSHFVDTAKELVVNAICVRLLYPDRTGYSSCLYYLLIHRINIQHNFFFFTVNVTINMNIILLFSMY